jgi:hypothetical protein
VVRPKHSEAIIERTMIASSGLGLGELLSLYFGSSASEFDCLPVAAPNVPVGQSG